ncbi:uncharacterized protein CHSO_2300 [Chryseobacterium sp. StRB126]|nr:uncharacterized protein CHSO_2300 [Chryseobacterium sp. StRB126]
MVDPASRANAPIVSSFFFIFKFDLLDLAKLFFKDHHSVNRILNIDGRILINLEPNVKRIKFLLIVEHEDAGYGLRNPN